MNDLINNNNNTQNYYDQNNQQSPIAPNLNNNGTDDFLLGNFGTSQENDFIPPIMNNNYYQNIEQDNTSNQLALNQNQNNELQQKTTDDILSQNLSAYATNEIINNNNNVVDLSNNKPINSLLQNESNNFTNDQTYTELQTPNPSQRVNLGSSNELYSPQNNSIDTKELTSNLSETLVKNTYQNSATIQNKYEKISDLLDLVVKEGASDLHITANYPPYLRIDDNLIPIGAPITPEEAKKFISQVLNPNQLELLEVNKEIDLSYQHTDNNRFRINAFYQKGYLSGAFRLIPNKIRTISELNLPSNLLEITSYSQGFFLVTGPTGSGKSTTLAALIQYINENYPKHIITIEDPIEYVYPKAKALVDQRELGSDTHDWNIAMKSALRQDPDVILIGELRDFETIQLALTLAETGHLVFATLHTNSASQSIDRIIDVFPPHQQQQVRIQLAATLKGILSQRLVPLVNGGRTLVIELLLINNAVQNLIREGKTYQIDNVIATGVDLGMISMEKSLVKLVREGKITMDTAISYASKPEEIQKLLKTSFI